MTPIHDTILRKLNEIEAAIKQLPEEKGPGWEALDELFIRLVRG